MDSIVERLARPGPVLLDGATGTELGRRGVELEPPLWSARALVAAPELLRQIHADYVAAGAEVVIANTFRTYRRNLVPAGMGDRAAELTRRAVEIARGACGERAWVAGSQPPLEDCYSPERVPDDDALAREHAEMSRQLSEAGVDLIVCETHNTVREAVAAGRAAAATGLPVFVSFVCGRDGALLSGESLADAVRAVLPLGPAAVLVNCLPAPFALAAVKELAAAAAGIPIGVYANIGYFDRDRGWINTDARDPDRYAAYARTWLTAGTRLIGGCCGTTPEHIRRLPREC